MVAGPKVIGIVATAGRPGVVGQVLEDLVDQTHRLDAIVVSVPDATSLPSEGVPDGVTVVSGTRGSAAQRNAGLMCVPDADIAFFFDDDSRVREDYVQQGLAVFAADEQIIGLSGRVLIDGAAGATAREIDTPDALSAIAKSRTEPLLGTRTPRFTLHGCNFAVRVGRTDQRFDDRLPLYSWLEDHDLARRLLREGSLVTASDCVIVHRGVKSGGRQSHTRFGYSQVMNPAYFVKKGSFPLTLAIREIGRPVGRNVRDAISGADRHWRRERLRGNLIAGFDVVRRRFTPERILDL